MSWIDVRFDGEQPVVIDHRWWRPGDTRRISESRWNGLTEEYPGLFSVIGDYPSEELLEQIEQSEDAQVALFEDKFESVESLGLSTRIVDVLVEAGITSAKTLLDMDDDDLLAIGGIGSGSVRMIRERLADWMAVDDQGA